ncbi:MAG: hypothetical protein EP343_29990 [Deltaproteobacteria bacterium]|nr:MAG: hypothetical protein EP343_29990 [Deltaproteobacteria bacterium]
MSWLFHPRMLLFGTMLLALAPTLWLSWNVTQRQTGPRILRWVNAKGQPLWKNQARREEVTSCQGDDHFKTLRFGPRLWTVCAQGIFTSRHHTRFQHGVYVRMDPQRQEAKAAWPLPPEQPLYQTLGLLPSASGKLAIVYRAQHSHGRLVVAVAGNEGWLLSPAPLPRPWEGRLLGIRWDKEALEVVVTSSSVMDRFGLRSAPALFRWTPSPQGPWQHSKQRLPYSSLCLNKKPCRVIVAYHPGPSHSWHLLVQSKTLWDVALQPSHNKKTSQSSTKPTSQRAKANEPSWSLQRKERPKLRPFASWLRRKVSFAMTGLLHTSSSALTYRWTPSGQAKLLDSLHGWDKGLRRVKGHYLVTNGWMKLQTRWSHAPLASIQKLDGKRIRLHYPRRSKPKVKRFEHIKRFAKPKPAPMYPASLRAERIATWRTVSLGTLARYAPKRCANLYEGAWIRSGKRRWLLSPTGCFLTLNVKWRRIDPLPLRRHLRQRSSSLQRPLPPWWGLVLLWIGGPLSLLVGWFAARITQTEGMQTQAARARASWWAFLTTLFFLTTSFYLGWKWLPFL